MERSELVERLGLAPHPEGGWYRETWRSPATFQPEGYAGPRHAATAIYFLLHPGEESAWHVVRSDELWLHHSGGPLLLRHGGSGELPAETHTSLLDATHPQVLIPAGVWQAAEPTGDEPVLVSCVVAPGFDFADFKLQSPGYA